jgi:hypothetical protein
MISTGFDHALVLNKFGAVFSFGRNDVNKKFNIVWSVR